MNFFIFQVNFNRHFEVLLEKVNCVLDEMLRDCILSDVNICKEKMKSLFNQKSVLHEFSRNGKIFSLNL